MAIPEDFLKPISDENPSGQNLRYVVYDKIKEARREEEAISSGVWSHELKKADFLLVIKLATEALTKQSKDLHIAAWLTEAWLVQNGIPGLQNGLNLIRGLIETFWETLYPQIEDGDLEMRVGPVEWVAERLEITIHRVPLTRNKLDWFRFQESTKIAPEQEATGDESKMAARLAAIEEKKCTPEEFNDSAKRSGAAFYEQLHLSLESAKESAIALETLCDERFKRVAPSFKNLIQAIDDLQEVVRLYYTPEPEPQDVTVPAGEESETGQQEQVGGPGAGQTSAGSGKSSPGLPVDREDALGRLVALSDYLRRQNPADPSGYLILRGIRWGELRISSSEIDPQLLEAPPSEVRQKLKKLSQEELWAEVLDETERSMAHAWSRGWLDLHRHAVRAADSLGYEPVARAIRSELRSLLLDYTELPTANLTDDTPAANEETKDWIRSTIVLPAPSHEPDSAISGLSSLQSARTSEAAAATDIYVLVQAKAKEGNIQEAIELLNKEIAQERSGRARFTRKFQMASICFASKYEAIAYPILVELVEEIDSRKLEEWEDASTIAHPLALLFRCLNKLGADDLEKQKIYQKICRLDPLLALSVGK